MTSAVGANKPTLQSSQEPESSRESNSAGLRPGLRIVAVVFSPVYFDGRTYTTDSSFQHILAVLAERGHHVEYCAPVVFGGTVVGREVIEPSITVVPLPGIRGGWHHYLRMPLLGLALWLSSTKSGMSGIWYGSWTRICQPRWPICTLPGTATTSIPVSAWPDPTSCLIGEDAAASGGFFVPSSRLGFGGVCRKWRRECLSSLPVASSWSYTVRMHITCTVLSPAWCGLQPHPPFSPIARNTVELTILFLSRVAPLKGIEDLLQGLANVESDLPVRLRLSARRPAGEFLASLQELARNYGVEDIVDFVGPIAFGSALWDEYLKADVYVLPSLFEGTPKTILEAMATGPSGSGDPRGRDSGSLGRRG